MTSRVVAPKYRMVGYDSTVDESLFGNGEQKNTMGRSTRRMVTEVPHSAAIVSVNELMRIKNSSIIQSDQEIKVSMERTRREKEDKQQVAQERKMKMRELERKAQLNAKKSDAEIADEGRKQAKRMMAEAQMDKNSDVVKLLNSMALRASSFSIREQQLEEKHRLEQVEKDYERRMDMLSELDRLKEIKQREEEARYKQQKMAKDREVINEQIETRRRQKVLGLEAREQEMQATRNMMAKYEEEDKMTAANRAITLEKSKAEVLRVNAQSIAMKATIREREKQEMADILLYQMQRDADIQKREDEEAEQARHKKEREMKLLGQQEKAMNNAGKLDELRARRAAEEKERKARAQEKEKARKNKADIDDLMRGRAKQAEDKQRRRQGEQEDARQEIIDNAVYMQKMAQREEREQEKKRTLTEAHRVSLNTQIDEIRRKRASEQAPENTLHQELIREEAKLKVIRDKMVRDLIADGVDEKYLQEMRGVDIAKMLRR